MRNRIFDKFAENLLINNTTIGIHEILEKNYYYLESLLTKDGALIDRYARSALDFQYHIPWFVLSSSMLYKIENKKVYIKNIEKTFTHLNKIGFNVNKRSNSFISIPLSLSLIFLNESSITDPLSKYITNIDHYPEYDSNQNANNFFCLKMLALLLKKEILHINLKQEDLAFIDKIINIKIPTWQSADGFFYDSPYTIRKRIGTPHLTYHATMWMTLIFSALLLDDKKLIERSRLAFKALESVTGPNGEISYGRSNNASFGYSSAILACTLHSIIEPKDKAKLLKYRNKLLKSLLDNRADDGHFYIVPNPYEKKRCGFDHYMFVTVYGSWTLGLLLLSHLLIPFEEND